MKKMLILTTILLSASCTTVNTQAIRREMARRAQMPTEQRLELLERETLELRARLGVTAGDAGAAAGIAIGGVW